uniref:Anoctamin n=1 Tax=Romanomermis culicivorax TaxID=13658 RepID=A0A915L421_ROMCU
MDEQQDDEDVAESRSPEFRLRNNVPEELALFQQSSQSERGLLALFINDISSSGAVDYMVKRLSALMVNGGPEFMVKISPSSDSVDTTILLLDCETERLLVEAEKCYLRKRTQKGDMLPFVRQKPPDAKYKFENLNSLLSSSEKIRLAMQILSHVCVNSDDMQENPDLKKGEPLSNSCLTSRKNALSVIGIVGDILPLHDITELHRLGAHWHSAPLSMFEPSYDEIRDYFGEKISIYFAFLGYYTKALILPSLLALYNCVLYFQNNNVHAQAPFAAFNLIYLIIFLKFWKRRCSTLAYGFGTYGFTKYEMPRPDFKGIIRLSPITLEMELWYPKSSRYRIMICETYPLVSVCCFLALLAMWAYFIVQLYVEKHFSKWTFRDFLILNTPTIVYSLLIEISNRLYKKLALKLTFRENHRLPSEHEYHLLVKLICFQFVNCFCYLFYVAFVLQDLEKLRRYLACVLVVWQIEQQILECVIPFVRIYLCQKFSLLKLRKDNSGRYISDIVLESKMDVYEDTFDDYLEMWCQFGYAFMFSSVFPLASFYALANNLMEMRSDAFKLCMSMRRPFPQIADSMGIWQSAFEALIIIAVMTNCALLGMTASTSAFAFKKWEKWHIVVLFLIVEHAMLFVYFVVNNLIADVPERIRLKVARSEYLAHENNLLLNLEIVRRYGLDFAGFVVDDPAAKYFPIERRFTDFFEKAKAAERRRRRFNGIGSEGGLTSKKML